jgi:putative ABC transport system permease protein
MVFIGLLFSVIAGERRREMAVLRAIGAKRTFIMRMMLSEAAFLAAGGSVLGIFLSSSLLYLFRNFISGSLQMPFLFPSLGSALELFAIGFVLAVVTIIIAVSIPAFRVSRQELAIAMRE